MDGIESASARGKAFQPRQLQKMATSSQPADDDEIDLGRLLTTLWSGKWWIGLFAAAGIAVAAIIFANTAPTYQADALLQLEENSAAMALPSSLSGLVDSDPRSITEIEILRSRLVLGQAVADLNLDWQVRAEQAPVFGTLLARYRLPILTALLPVRFARPGEALQLQELIVPPNWLGQELIVTVLEGAAFHLNLPDGTVLDGVAGMDLVQPEIGFSIRIADIRAAPGRMFRLRQIPEASAISALRSRLTVSERGRASGILELRLTGEERQKNARALDAILFAYQRQNISRSSAQAEGSLDFIRDQIPQAERSLREAEAELNAFRMQQTTVDLSLETQTTLNEVTRLEAELSDVERRLEEVARRFTPAHPSHRTILDDRQRLQTRLVALRQQVSELPETQRQIINLQRDVDLAQRLYLDLLTRAQQVEVLRASTIGSVRIIDIAVPVGGPIAPRRTLLLAMGLIMGAIGGAAFVFLRSWLRKGLQDASELERFGLPVFATVNYNKLADTKNRRTGALPILAVTDPTDLAVESLRSLRTSLHFGMLDARTPSLVITSTHPEAGKSFLSVNLAVVAAQAGQKVCLIDADLRRGQLRRYMNQARNHPGLVEVLAGDVTPDRAVVEGPLENLFFIGTGRYPPNPSELLMRNTLDELLEWAAAHFDLTILDTPPILAVTDPVIISNHAGMSILVARHDVTLPGEVEAAMKAFESAGQKLSGAVLNGFDPRKSKAGYGYGYSYRYSYQQRTE